MMKKLCLKKFKGIGLLELMLSLSIIAILLLLATRYYLTTSYAQKLNQLSQQISAIQGSIYTWKGGKNNYAGLSAESLIAQGLIPKVEQKDNKTIISPWGTSITVKSEASDMKASISFDGNAISAEAKACENLAASFNANAPEEASAKCDSGVFTYIFP